MVAHPRRSAWVSHLANTTAAEAVSWDRHKIGCEANHLQAWNYLADSPEQWGVVIEDDVIPCQHFTRQLTQVLTAAPTPVVSLYLGRAHPHGGADRWQDRIAAHIAADVCWLTADALLSGQGYAIRTELIPDMLETVTPLSANHRRKEQIPIDEAVSTWCRSRGYLVGHTRPSILNHLDGKTLIPQRADKQPRRQGRVAWLFDWRERWDSSAQHLEQFPVIAEDVYVREGDASEHTA